MEKSEQAKRCAAGNVLLTCPDEVEGMETTKQKLVFAGCYFAGGMTGFALHKVASMDPRLMFLAVLLGAVIAATAWGVVQTYLERSPTSGGSTNENGVPMPMSSADNVIVLKRPSK